MFKYIEYINKLFVSLKLRNLSPHNKCEFNWYGKTVRNVKVRKTLDWEWMKYGIHLKDLLKIFVHVWIHYLRFWKKLILLFIFFCTDWWPKFKGKEEKEERCRKGGRRGKCGVRQREWPPDFLSGGRVWARHVRRGGKSLSIIQTKTSSSHVSTINIS